MAKKNRKKRLNIKVAIIGLLFVGVIGMGVLYLWYKSGRDPQKFLVEAEQALENKDYKLAEKSVGIAYTYSKNHLERIDILFKLADLAMVEDPGDPALGREPKEPNWGKAIAIFDKITASDPKNIEARLKMLNFTYEVADMGRAYSWNEVKKTSDELMIIYDEKNKKPEPFVVMARGRASLEIAIAGSAVDLQKEVDDARKFINILLQMEPDNFDALWYLAHTEMLQGEINDNAGIIGAMEDGMKRAEAIIQESIDRNPANPDAYINMLKLKILASESGKTSADSRATLEEQYRLIKNKFPDNPDVDYEMAGFYYRTPLDIDKAVEVIDSAVAKDPMDYDYLFRASMTYYLKYCLAHEDLDWLNKAIVITKQALELPEAKETKGPEETRNKNNILVLNNLLSNYYAELAKNSEGESRQEALVNLEKSIARLKKIIMVDENPILSKWVGMHKYYSGLKDEGLAMLITAEKQLNSQGTPDSQLCYSISGMLTNESVIGAKQIYLGRAIENNIVFLGRPSAVLDYSDILLKLRSPDNAISLVQRFEEVMGTSKRSKEILIEAYIQANQFEKAENLIDEYRPDSKQALVYRLEIAEQKTSQLLQIRARQKLYNDPYAQNKINSLTEEIREIRLKRLELVRKLFREDPEYLKDYNNIAGILIDVVQEGYLPKAIEFNEEFLAKYPQTPSAILMRKRFSRPDPMAFSSELLTQLQVEVLKELDIDELERQESLGQIYMTSQQYDKAKECYIAAQKLAPENVTIIAALFDIALSEKDFDKANEYSAEATKLNIDGCGGLFFAGRLEVAKENVEAAIEKFKACINIKPIFPSAYLNLSLLYDQKGEYDLAVENAKMAATYSPTNSQIALNNALVLYKRNQALATDVTVQQKEEAQNAILRAIRVNPANIELQSVYAEYIAETDAGSALAMRQSIFQASPTKRNALLLARMALKNSTDAFNSPKKEAMYRIAEDAFKNALALAPGDSEVLDAYSDFYRISGQEDKIISLIGDNKQILWKSYFRCSQFDKARDVLLELTKDDPDNKEYVLGLLGVSIRLFDKQGVDLYSKRLIEVENTLESNILRIKAFIEIGATDTIEPELATAAAENPDNTEIKLLQATLALRKGYFEQATSIATDLLAVNSKNPTAWKIKGKANYLKADYEKALDDFKKCKALEDDTSIRIDLARTYDRLNRYEPAISELSLTLEDESTPVIALLLLEEVYMRAMKYTQLGDFYTIMVKRFPDSTYWPRRIGDLQMKMGNADKAEIAYKDAWDKAISLSKDDPASMLGYANALREQGKNAEVLAILSKHVDASYNVEVFTVMAQTRHSMGNIEKSAENFVTAMKFSAKNPNKIRFVLSKLVDTFDKQSATDIVYGYLQDAKDRVNAYMCAYQLNFNYTNYNKSVEEIDRAIAETSPESPMYKQLLIIKANTLLYSYRKVPDKEYTQTAARIYDELLKQMPGDVNVLNNLAYLLAVSNYDLERAEQVAAKAYNAASENGLIMDTYGLTLIKNRKYDKAEMMLSRAIQAIELNSTSAPSEVYEHYGLALERLNKPQEAKDAYERALRAEEDLPKEKIEEIEDKIARLSKRIF